MRTIIVIAFLIGSLDLVSQSRETGIDRYGWGPGTIGECVDTNDLQTRLRTTGFGIPDSTGESFYFRISGNSLYKGGSGSDCYVKVGDVYDDILGIDYNCMRHYITLWTSSDEYRYNVLTNVLERYSAYGLLSPFLARPVKGLSATSSVWGCFGGFDQNITYSATDSDDSFPSLKYEHKPRDMESYRGDGINRISGEKLVRILRGVNLEPNQIPSLADFDINEEDKIEYARQVKEDVRGFGWSKYDMSSIDSAAATGFYLRLLPCFDTVSREVVRAARVSFESVSGAGALSVAK